MISIFIPHEEVVQGFFTGEFMLHDPGQITGQVEDLGYIGNKIGVRVHQIAPLCFVKSPGINAAGDGIFIQVGPPGNHTAIRLNGVIPIVIQAFLVAFYVGFIVDADCKLCDVLFVQTDGAIGGMPTVPAK